MESCNGEDKHLERLKNAKDLEDLGKIFREIIAEMIADWVKENLEVLIGNQNAISK